MKTEYRFAAVDDAEVLADLNHMLIHDEGHRNSMTVQQLQSRMVGFLSSDYTAVLFLVAGEPIGYCLYRREPEYFYLRQFFVCEHVRRRDIGRDAMKWLADHVWGNTRVRIEVLVGNNVGLAFWRAVGLMDYAVTLEMHPST